MTTVWQDIRYGVRMLWKSPGFTAVTVLMLALGIGVNTAIFSLLNAVWMRSLPVRDPHALRVVNWSGHNATFSHFTGTAGDGRSRRGGAAVSASFPYPVYRDFKEQVEGCSAVFAFFELPGMTVIGAKGAATTDVLMVSGDFFNGYGAEAALGRTLQPRDESSQADPVAVITYRWWEREYDLDPQVLGQMMSINGHPFTIVGVLPRSYCGPQIGDMARIYVPMSAQPVLSPGHRVDARDHWWASIMVRVRPRADEAQIQAAMEGLLLQTLSVPGQGTRADNPHIALVDGSRGLLGIRRQMAFGFTVLMAAVGLVLLIACANLAGLLLARGAARRPELTIRAALGAGRGRLVRQLLTESLILSLAGAGLGLLVAVWVKAAMLGFLPGSLESFHLDTSTDLRVLLFTLGVAVGTSLLFGLLPALRTTRVDLISNLKSQRVPGVSGLRLGGGLVAAQAGLSVLLLVGAGLLMRTLVNLYRVDLGFTTDRILVFGVNPSQGGYQDADSVRFYDQVEAGIAALPGVTHVALSSYSLLGGGRSASAFSIPGRLPQGDQHLQADILNVSETFLQTMEIPLLRGRAFERTDSPSQPRVVIVNEALARACFPHEDPLGQSIRLGERDYQIVGLCGNARYDRVQRAVEPTLYFSHRQATPGAMHFEVRTTGDPLVLVPAVRKVVTDLDRTIPLENVSTQLQLLKESITPERLFAYLCGSLALLGVLLSCIGLYGLTAYNVGRRRSEIGVRMALGARPKDVAWPVVRSALLVVAIGIGFGGAGALALVRLIKSQLYGVDAHDPVTLVGSVLFLLTVAALAAWLPARRASRIDPMAALRCE
ncbi:MAG: ABC transporter permease [Sedimentisphaerales bacterium]|nr:ABC transporter permease [Sedimentisphaerales bacterium]